MTSGWIKRGGGEQDRGAPIERGKGKERKGRLGRGKKRAVIENRSKIRDAAFLSNLPESWSWNDEVVGVAFATMAEGGGRAGHGNDTMQIGSFFQ